MDDISCGGVLKAKIIKNQKQFSYFNITQKRKFFKRLKPNEETFSQGLCVPTLQ